MNTVLVRAVFPVTVVAWATVQEQRGAGLLHLWPIKSWLSIVLALIALDLAIYLRRRLFHAVPAFWRLYHMHHADTEFDHTNVQLPGTLDHVLRQVVVMPEMHRVHHLVLPQETNSNFGFNSPWWDCWFGTCRAQPRDGHQGMRIGLPQFWEPTWLRLDRMLVQPWVKPGSDEV